MNGLTDLEAFSVEVAEHVATVTIRRPPVNAQNRRFREEIIRIFDALHDTPDVRAIVLTGEGRAFSAGADLKERPGLADEAGAYPRHNRLVRASFDCIMECEKPVIAAVNGAAIGAGCVLALCCDIVVASENAFLSMTEVDVGLAGGVRHIMRHFGQSDARLMIYTARRITGPELYRMNVASACVPGSELTGHRARHRAGDRGQGAAGDARCKAFLHPDGGSAAARGLPLRAVADRRPGEHRGYQGGAARLCGEAQARLQGTLRRTACCGQTGCSAPGW